MKRRFEGHKALITGSTQRLGLEMAKALASQGADIVCHFHESDNVSDALADLESHDVKAMAIQADLSHRSGAEFLLQKVLEQCPDLTILVHSASIYRPDHINNADADSVLSSLWVHGLSPWILSRGFFQHFKKASNIVNILDGALNKHQPNYFSYEMGKKILKHLTEVMAIEFVPRVRVNGIALGPFLSKEENQSSFDEAVKKLPIPRSGTIEELVQTLFFVIENDYMTGNIVFIDGGWHNKGGTLTYS
ncbi:MAG: SDR family oxidoreductase [Bdellovibrionales bacterium]|nr:SDR family oxidoreductase [Bdellovibrionales bacterium]